MTSGKRGLMSSQDLGVSRSSPAGLRGAQGAAGGSSPCSYCVRLPLCGSRLTACLSGEGGCGQPLGTVGAARQHLLPSSAEKPQSDAREPSFGHMWTQAGRQQ